MFTPISIRNLVDGAWQTVLSLVGISFAIILIFMQLGFLGAVLDTAVLFYNNLNFDLVVRSPDYYHFADAKTFSPEYLRRIENVNGVAETQPLHISLGRWSYPEKSVQRGMLILGVDSRCQTFESTKPDVIVPDVSLLVNDRSLLVDVKSRPEFLGFDNSKRFSENDIGLRIELNDNECEVVGLFKIGTGLAANGAAVVNDRTYKRIFPNYGNDRVALGLVCLDDSSLGNPSAVRDRIYQSLNVDPAVSTPIVEVLTRAEAIDRERRHWLFNTPVGFIFLTGLVISFVVGAIIVYIVLSSDISKQMAEYATLKAMGYRDGFLYRVVLEQAILLGIVGYFISFAITSVLYRVVGDAANLPMNMTFSRQLIVFVASMVMCCLSAMVAMQKLRKADPADLY